MLKKIVYILFILTLNLSVVANNNDREKVVTKTISGKITSLSGEEIAGAKIVIEETGETYFSDLNGNFKLVIKADKIYSLVIETIGFEPLTVSSNKIGSFSDLSLNSL